MNLKFIPTPSIPFNSIDILNNSINTFKRKRLIIEQFKDENDTSNNPWRKFKISKPDWQPNPNEQIEKEVELIRKQLLFNLNTNIKFKHNLSYKQRRALISLKSNTSIIIVPTDKNLGIAIIDKDKYLIAGEEYVNNKNCFSPATLEDFNNNNKDFKSLIIKSINIPPLKKDKSNKELIFKLTRFLEYLVDTTVDPTIPSLYFLPKVHKPKLAWRPILGAYKTTVTNFSIYLADLFQPHIALTTSYLRDSQQLQEIIKNNTTIINESTILAAADVEALYPNININLLIRYIIRDLPTIINNNNNKTIFPFIRGYFIQLIVFILKKNIVKFNNNYHLQISGITMGNNVSVQFGNLFMANLEYELVEKYTLLHSLALYKRYIDDCFIIWKGTYSQLLDFFKEFNQLCDTINLTFEHSYSSITMLDLEIYKEKDTLQTKTHQKALNKYLYIPYRSYHSKAMHRGWIRSELRRYKRQCSAPIQFRKIRNQFYQRLRARGFPTFFLQDLFFQTDTIPKNSKNGKKQLLTLTLPFKPSFTSLNPKNLIQNFVREAYFLTVWKRAKNLRDLLSNSKI